MNGTSILEILFGIAMFALLLIPAVVYGQWLLFSVFLIFGIIFGGVEVYAKKKTGKTVSQHFWKFSEKNKIGAWIILGCMMLAWIFLILHLAIKIL